MVGGGWGKALAKGFKKTHKAGQTFQLNSNWPLTHIVQTVAFWPVQSGNRLRIMSLIPDCGQVYGVGNV